MAIRGRSMRGGPSGRAVTAETDASRVVTSVTSSRAIRQAQAAAAPSRPGKVSLISESLNVNFFRDAMAELRKVTWPTREQATNLTVLVIAVSLATGVLLGAFDYISEKLFAFLLSL
jgi:preprotein translocase subunit SecE